MAIYYTRQDGAWEDPATWTTDPATDAPASSYPGQSTADDTAIIRHRVTLNSNLVLHGDPSVVLTGAYAVASDRAAILFIRPTAYTNYTEARLTIADTVSSVETSHVVIRRWYWAISGIPAYTDISGGIQIGSSSSPRTHNGFTWRFVRVDSSPSTQFIGFVSGHGSLATTFDWEFYGDTSQNYRVRVVNISGTTIELDQPIKADVGDKLFITPTDATNHGETRTITAISGTTITLDSPLTYSRDLSKTIWAFNRNRAINIYGGFLRWHFAANSPNEKVVLKAVGMPDQDPYVGFYEASKLAHSFEIEKSLLAGHFAEWIGYLTTVGYVKDSEFLGGWNHSKMVPVEDSIYLKDGKIQLTGSYKNCWFFGQPYPADATIEDSHVNHHNTVVWGAGTNDLNVFQNCDFGDIYFKPSLYWFALYEYYPGKVAWIDCRLPYIPSNPRSIFHITPHGAVTIVMKNIKSLDESQQLDFWGAYKGVAMLSLDTTDYRTGTASLKVEFERTGVFTFESVVLATQNIALGVVGEIKTHPYVDLKVELIGAGIKESIALPSSGNWESFSIGGVPNDTRTVKLRVVAAVNGLPAEIKFDNFKLATGKVDTGEFETYGAIAPVSPFPQVLASSLTGASEVWNAPTSVATNPAGFGQFIIKHDKKQTAFRFM